MTAARKVKVSVTLSADVLDAVDRSARASGSRSSVMDQWLRIAARSEVERDLERATVEYYLGLSPGERTEDAAISLAAGKAAQRLRIDGAVRRRRG